MLRIRLEMMGFAVEDVGSGEEALACCRRSPPDAIVLDQRMPGLSGLEVGRELRDTGYRGFVLLYSAYLTPIVEEEAHTLGLAVVPKTQVTELVDLLREALEEGRLGLD